MLSARPCVGRPSSRAILHPSYTGRHTIQVCRAVDGPEPRPEQPAPQTENPAQQPREATAGNQLSRSLSGISRYMTHLLACWCGMQSFIDLAATNSPDLATRQAGVARSGLSASGCLPRKFHFYHARACRCRACLAKGDWAARRRFGPCPQCMFSPPRTSPSTPATELSKGSKRLNGSTNLLLSGESLDTWRRLDSKARGWHGYPVGLRF